MAIKRDEEQGVFSPMYVPENAEDAQFHYTYNSCLKACLEEIKGLGQDQINAIFDKYHLTLAEGPRGEPRIAIEYPGGVPSWIIAEAKEYAKKFK